MQFKVRRAVIGDEPVLRALRLQALTDSPGAFSSTYERELARTTEDWRRWLAPDVTFILEAGGEPRGLVAGSRDAQGFSAVHLMAMWCTRLSGAQAQRMPWYRLSRPGPPKSAPRRSFSKSSRPTALPGASTNAPVFVPQAIKAWSRKVVISKWRWPATCSLVTTDARMRYPE